MLTAPTTDNNNWQQRNVSEHRTSYDLSMTRPMLIADNNNNAMYIVPIADQLGQQHNHTNQHPDMKHRFIVRMVTKMMNKIVDDNDDKLFCPG